MTMNIMLPQLLIDDNDRLKTYWPGSTKDIVVYDAARAVVTR